jgi:hypothetical protein
MEAYRAGRRLAVLAVVLSCVTAATTGCTVDANNTSNTNNGNCDAAGASNQPNCPQSQNSSGTVVSASAPPAVSSAPPNGTQLGSYYINLEVGYFVPLDATKPTQSQFNRYGIGDLGTGDPADILVYLPISPDQMIDLPGGSVPTYQACTSDTVFSSEAASTVGTVFCLLETGKVAGVTVTGDGASYATLHIVIWQNVS